MVEDDANLRFMLRLILERSGYQVNEAVDGIAALLAIDNAMPDLVITDVRMPRMDGSSLIQRLRLRESTARLPIILISAYAVLPATATQADLVLPKPVALERVVEAVTRLLGDRRNRSPSTAH